MQKKQKWLPPYNAIILLSALAAIIVTSAFLYFSATLYLAEKAISRPPDLPGKSENALRLLIAMEPDKEVKSPLEADILSYLNQKMGRKVIPVQRVTSAQVDRVLAENKFDIAFISPEIQGKAAKEGHTELLLIPESKHDPAEPYLVSVRKSLDANTKQKMKEILLNMDKDDSGRKVLSNLGFRSFVDPASSGNSIPKEKKTGR